MWIKRTYICVVLLTVLQSRQLLSADNNTCCKSWINDGWQELGTERFEDQPTPVCKAAVTGARMHKGQTIMVNFKPPNRYGILGISACIDDSHTDCYVAIIFGLTSGKVGYWWRKQSLDEKGERNWAPGRSGQLPTTLLQSYTLIKEGTWDQEGKTVYQFYVEKTLDDRFGIRLNGGDANQQKEMSFPLPERYSWITVAAYYDRYDNFESKAFVEGAAGCARFKRVTFTPGQDLRINWLRPFGALGISMCTDSGQSDCYVLDAFGSDNGKLNYWWRKHSTTEGGLNGWVPGREYGLPEKILKSGPNEKRTWRKDGLPLKSLDLILKRDFDKNLTIEVLGGDPNQAADLAFDVPANYQYTSVGALSKLFGLEINYNHIRLLGPCFNGEKLGYLSLTCRFLVHLDSLSTTVDKGLEIWAPKPGRTESEIVSPVLALGSTRRQLCVFLEGVASPGAIIDVSALPASSTGSAFVEPFYIGSLAYNATGTVIASKHALDLHEAGSKGFFDLQDINPPEWQQVRLSKLLPSSLQNVSLVIKLTAKRSPTSFVVLRKAELCSYDGCGLPTAEGTPQILNGEEASLAKFPWHVGIYRKEGILSNYICGGSLIRPDVVISAAHCFSNGKEKVDAKHFILSVGKIYSSLYEFEPETQLSNALEIHIPERYRGVANNYLHDLAVVRVNFTLTSVVLPLCIDWTNRGLPTLKSGDVGEVAGWGYTERNVTTASRELLFAELPFIPYQECVSHWREPNWRYISDDKFCAGHIDGQTVMHGDSGGGLAFKAPGGLWYLRGIVSVGIKNERTYSAFTDVSKFMPWIREVLGIHNESLIH